MRQSASVVVALLLAFPSLSGAAQEPLPGRVNLRETAGFCI